MLRLNFQTGTDVALVSYTNGNILSEMTQLQQQVQQLGHLLSHLVPLFLSSTQTADMTTLVNINFSNFFLENTAIYLILSSNNCMEIFRHKMNTWIDIPIM